MEDQHVVLKMMKKFGRPFDLLMQNLDGLVGAAKDPLRTRHLAVRCVRRIPYALGDFGVVKGTGPGYDAGDRRHFRMPDAKFSKELFEFVTDLNVKCRGFLGFRLFGHSEDP
jgi:hypothetical protein